MGAKLVRDDSWVHPGSMELCCFYQARDGDELIGLFYVDALGRRIGLGSGFIHTIDDLDGCEVRKLQPGERIEVTE